MWDDHRLLNALASTLYVMVGIAIAYALGVAIVRLPIFPIRVLPSCLSSPPWEV